MYVPVVMPSSTTTPPAGSACNSACTTAIGCMGTASYRATAVASYRSAASDDSVVRRDIAASTAARSARAATRGTSAATDERMSPTKPSRTGNVRPTKDASAERCSSSTEGGTAGPGVYGYTKPA